MTFQLDGISATTRPLKIGPGNIVNRRAAVTITGKWNGWSAIFERWHADGRTWTNLSGARDPDSLLPVDRRPQVPEFRQPFVANETRVMWFTEGGDIRLRLIPPVGVAVPVPPVLSLTIVPGEVDVRERAASQVAAACAQVRDLAPAERAQAISTLLHELRAENEPAALGVIRAAIEG